MQKGQHCANLLCAPHVIALTVEGIQAYHTGCTHAGLFKHVLTAIHAKYAIIINEMASGGGADADHDSSANGSRSARTRWCWSQYGRSWNFTSWSNRVWQRLCRRLQQCGLQQGYCNVWNFPKLHQMYHMADQIRRYVEGAFARVYIVRCLSVLNLCLSQCVFVARYG